MVYLDLEGQDDQVPVSIERGRAARACGDDSPLDMGVFEYERRDAISPPK